MNREKTEAGYWCPHCGASLIIQKDPGKPHVIACVNGSGCGFRDTKTFNEKWKAEKHLEKEYKKS